MTPALPPSPWPRHTRAAQRVAPSAPRGWRKPVRGRPRPDWRLLLGFVLVLFIGQALAGVHALGHQLQGESDACSLCQFAGAPALPAPPLSLEPSQAARPAESPAPVLVGPARRARRDRHARAPPV